MGNTPPSSPPSGLRPETSSAASVTNQIPNHHQPSSTGSQNWIHSTTQGPIPSNAIIGGNEADGTVMYVGRSFHNGDMLVAKYMPSKRAAYVSWHGEEVKKDHFELLCGENFIWRPCVDHVIPQSAVVCGTTKLGDPIYIGRGHYEGGLIVGKISTMHRALFIPYNGTEKRLDTYEILLQDTPPSGWSIPAPITEKKPKETEKSTELPPPPPYSPGFALSQVPEPSAPSAPVIYPNLPPSQQQYPPAPVRPIQAQKPMPTAQQPFASAQQKAPMSFPQQQPSMPQHQTMYAQPPQNPVFFAQPEVRSSIFSSNTFVPAKTGYQPHPGFGPTTSATNAPIPSIHFNPTQSMTPGTTKNLNIWASGRPGNAFRAGHDVDNTDLYICRASHEGDLIPGKIVPTHACAYISYGGNEVSKQYYETLVGDRYRWVEASYGNVPPGAVEGGRTKSGETLYIGRAYYKGSLTPGKIHCSHQCLYIPFGGKEKSIKSYEVLVHA